MIEHAKQHIWGLIDTGIDVDIPNKEAILEQFPLIQLRDNLSISSARYGTQVQTTVIISDCKLAETKSGDPMLKMRVYDSAGSYSANMFHRKGFDLAKIKEDIIDKYQFIDITADVQEFPAGSGKKTLNITKLEVDPTKKRSEGAYLNYLPRCRANLSEVILEMYIMLDNLREPHRSIALDALKKYWDRFAISPAATTQHHNYIFGLLEHTWGLLRLAYWLTKTNSSRDIVSNGSVLLEKLTVIALREMKKFKETKERTDYIYNFGTGNFLSHAYYILEEMVKCMHEKGDKEIDVDFLLAAIIWHDMGKINEYQLTGGIQRHDLMGITEHRVIGPIMFDQFVKEGNYGVDDTNPIYWHYVSVISSHHGKVEWGTPRKPATLEGWATHFVDFIDAAFQGRKLK